MGSLSYVSLIVLLAVVVHMCAAVCTPGYEPQIPLPGCIVRQQMVFDRVFAIFTNGKVFDNHSGQCLTLAETQILWQANGNIGSNTILRTPLIGCFTNDTICYSNVTATYSCGCLEDCSDVMVAFHYVGGYIFNNNLNVY